MEQKEYTTDDRKKKHLSIFGNRLIQMHNTMLSTIHTFVDKGQIILTMNNLEKIHSIKISEKLLLASDKKVIRDRLTRVINEAILSSSINGLTGVNTDTSFSELIKTIFNENHEIKESIEVTKNQMAQYIQKLSSVRKTVVSQSGNISVVISGGRVILSLITRDEYLTPGNKAIIETELMETVNRAIREVQEEIQGLFLKCEAEN